MKANEQKLYDAMINMVIDTIENSGLDEDLNYIFSKTGTSKAIEETHNKYSCLPYDLDFWQIIQSEINYRKEKAEMPDNQAIDENKEEYLEEYQSDEDDRTPPNYGYSKSRI